MFPAQMRERKIDPRFCSLLYYVRTTLQIEQGDPLIPTFAFRKLSPKGSWIFLNIKDYKRLIVTMKIWHEIHCFDTVFHALILLNHPV